MFKKIVIALLLLFPSIALASFPDVFSANPYLKAINYVQEKGIVNGYADGRFRSDASINRAEFVKILMKTKYSQSEISNCSGFSFKDVPSTEWYAPYVCLAKKKGVIDGNPDGTFAPDSNISFSEAAKILRNTLLPNDTLSTNFTTWYEPYVQVLADHHAIPVSISGFDASINRGEMAEMIYRLDTKNTSLASLTLDEIGYQKIIDTYYGYLSGHEYDKAYAMKIDPGTSLDAFKNLYKDFAEAYTLDFRKIAPSTFEFKVMTLPNISGGAVKMPSELYKVTMHIIDGKLKTIASMQPSPFVLEDVSSTGIGASLEWEDGFYKVYVTQNGTKTLAVQTDTKDNLSLIVKNLALSPSGQYLTFEYYNWEWSGVGLYDIASQKKINFNGTDFYGFTPGDKNFYFCSQSGMGSGDFAVVNFPGFSVERPADLSTDMIRSCGPYDASTGILHYQLGNPNGTITQKAFQVK